MKIKTTIIASALALLLAGCSTTRESPVQASSPMRADDHEQWLENNLRQIETIKAGSTRADLLKLFTEVSIGTRAEAAFVYRGSNYFVVEVKFKPVNNISDRFDLNPTDEITEISRPVFERAPTD